MESVDISRNHIHQHLHIWWLYILIALLMLIQKIHS